jgi:hypothetical protein
VGSAMLTREELKERYVYASFTGVFSRTYVPRNGYNGPVGHTRKDGYGSISINNKRYLTHRLAVLYMTGCFPTEVVDHIDGNPANNRWSNLRQCSQGENNRNKKWMTNNTSGYKGVYYHKTGKKWAVQLVVNKQNIYLGMYNDIELAGLVAEEARELYHGEYARHL